ncbi:MAG: 30S ribosomal protein S27ae [Candidatus Aenigmarchaeota archaeon]|nr:30S ribosomal protein S27ae [Candidatus Aenigmarchaeota archaeon]
MAKKEEKPAKAGKSAPAVAPAAAAEAAPAEAEIKKKKEKRSQKERPHSKKKHTKIQVWKLYSLKNDKIERRNQSCPRCGPGTFLAAYANRKYCGKCGWAMVQQAAQK